MLKFASIMRKDLKIMAKDPSALVVLFLLPIMFISVMSFALSSMYANEEAVQVVVYDQDQTDVSRALIQRLGEVDGLELVQTTEDGNAFTEEEARRQVEDGSSPAMVAIPQQFAAHLMGGNSTTIRFLTDPAQATSASLVKQMVNGVIEGVSLQFSQLSQEAKQLLERSLIAIESTTVHDDQPVEKPDAFQQNVPGYTVMFAFFSVMFAGRSFLSERTNGTFERMLAAPLGRWSLFFGKMLPYFFIGLLQVVIMFAIGHLVFGMGLGNSLLGLCVLSVCLVWASSSMGMMVATLFRTESQINGFSVMIVLTLASLGGTMVPLFVMPDVMQQVALITPHAWALTGYQDILVRGMGMADIWSNAVVLLGFGFVFLSVSVWKLRTERK